MNAIKVENPPWMKIHLPLKMGSVIFWEVLRVRWVFESLVGWLQGHLGTDLRYRVQGGPLLGGSSQLVSGQDHPHL